MCACINKYLCIFLSHTYFNKSPLIYTMFWTLLSLLGTYFLPEKIPMEQSSIPVHSTIKKESKKESDSCFETHNDMNFCEHAIFQKMKIAARITMQLHRLISYLYSYVSLSLHIVSIL